MFSSDIHTKEFIKNLKVFLNKVYNFLKKYWYFAVLCLIFTVGVALRLEAYFSGKQFHLDEGMLALSFLRNDGVLWVFRPLLSMQMAPPLFLICVKILANIFGYSELVLRFIPFLSSILAIPAFYLLSKKIMKTKAAIIFANFLFAINHILIRYGLEFKQYSTDVLVFILLSIWLFKEAGKKINWYDILKYGFIFTILFFISQPTIFLLSGFVLYKILQNIKDCKPYLIPIIPLCFILLYKSINYSTNSFMQYYWNLNFINLYNYVQLLRENAHYFIGRFLYLNILSYFIYFGLLMGLFSKIKSCRIISRIFLFSFFGLIFASVLHLYPVSERLILFLLPFLLMFAAKTFDILSCIKLKYPDKISVAVVIFLMFFISNTALKNRANTYYCVSRARDGIEILNEQFNPKTDTLILPLLSDMLVKYYSKIIPLKFDYNEAIIWEQVYDIKKIKLDAQKLTHGKTYWIFYTFDCGASPDVKKWFRKNTETYYYISLSKHTSLRKIKYK